MQVLSLGQQDSPGEGKGHQLQYSCLENPRVVGEWGECQRRRGPGQGSWSPSSLNSASATGVSLSSCP